MAHQSFGGTPPWLYIAEEIWHQRSSRSWPRSVGGRNQANHPTTRWSSTSTSSWVWGERFYSMNEWWYLMDSKKSCCLDWAYVMVDTMIWGSNWVNIKKKGDLRQSIFWRSLNMMDRIWLYDCSTNNLPSLMRLSRASCPEQLIITFLIWWLMLMVTPR